MDPITFGIVFTGATGGTLITLAVLGKKIRINESAIKIVLETAKYGTLLYFMKYLFITFL